MKKYVYVLPFCLLLFSGCESTQQILKDLGQTGTGTGTSTGSTTGGLSTNDIIAGLKEALALGAERSSTKLSAMDGFFKDAAIKILLPQEAQKVEKTLRDLGMGSLVDKAILSVNRAAEDAAKSAAPIFVNAVKSMTINDALGILKGSDTAATSYLKGKTTVALTNAFKPVIEKSLAKVNATKYWGDLFTAYNKFATNKVNTDLSAFVTERALSGIFYQVGQEEKAIRKDPVARTTDILKKVFGKNS